MILLKKTKRFLKNDMSNGDLFTLHLENASNLNSLCRNRCRLHGANSIDSFLNGEHGVFYVGYFRFVSWLDFQSVTCFIVNIWSQITESDTEEKWTNKGDSFHTVAQVF